jgi:hypothetical protein
MTGSSDPSCRIQNFMRFERHTPVNVMSFTQQATPTSSALREGLLAGEKQTSRFDRVTSAFDPQQTSRHALRKGLADNQSQYFARLRGLSLIHAHGVVDAERAGAIGRNVKKASRRHHVLKDLGDIAGIS